MAIRPTGTVGLGNLFRQDTHSRPARCALVRPVASISGRSPIFARLAVDCVLSRFRSRHVSAARAGGHPAHSANAGLRLRGYGSSVQPCAAEAGYLPAVDVNRYRVAAPKVCRILSGPERAPAANTRSLYHLCRLGVLMSTSAAVGARPYR